jgi:DNA-binding beta-propeller fold protein YncE
MLVLMEGKRGPMAKNPVVRAFGGLVILGIVVVAVYLGLSAQAPMAAPKYKFDGDWPKTMPNKWKIGGVTGLAVDNDDNVWVYDRPNDLRDIELNAETGSTDCCARPPSMIHIDKAGNVIGSFDPPQGHGMDVDSKGFVYLGNAVNGLGTVRKYDSKTGKLVAEIPHVMERQAGGGGGDAAPAGPRQLGHGGRGAVESDPTKAGKPPDPAKVAAFRAKYPPTTPMIVGGIEEVRLDETARELYTADNYLGGRIMVFDLDTFKFKRGWGAYGHKLSEITTNDADRVYMPNGPFPKEFRNHLTLNFSNDGLMYEADRGANRIQVNKKDGTFVKEFGLATSTKVPPPPDKPEINTGKEGSAGGVGFSPDKAQKFLYISDLSNNTVWFLNRADGKVVGRLGSMGENGGQFFGLHMIAVDSKGVIYTGEVFNGERVQRFLPVP